MSIWVCPYCGDEAVPVGADDDAHDYCFTCEMFVEGQTIEVDDDES